MRQPHHSSPKMEFGPYLFDSNTGKLTKHGTTIRLSGMPLKILAHLLERPSELASRQELQQLLWNNTMYGDFEKGLNSAINLLRKALHDSANQPRYIETLPGQGYRFIAPVHLICSVSNSDQLSIATPATVSSSMVVEENPPDNSGEREIIWPRNTSRIWVSTGVVLAVAAFAVGMWWALRPVPTTLLDGSTRPPENPEANDQFNLAFHFIDAQNDIPLARKTSERALALSPNFAAAHVQHALFSVIELWAGYNNDSSVVLKAEQEIQEAESKLPDSDGLLLAAKTAVHLTQGRLDRIPAAKLEEFTRQGGDPTWLATLRLLAGQTDGAIAMLRPWIERNPLHNPARMFLGEMLRTQGDTANAIQLLERTYQQGPRHATAAFFLTLAYLDAGKAEQAEALLLSMRPEFEKNYAWRCAWAILLASEGRHLEAAEVMDEETLKFARLSWVEWSSIADFYALQGEKEKAIDWLQFAVGRGDERGFYFQRNARLASLRDDARFHLMLKNLGSRRTAFFTISR